MLSNVLFLNVNLHHLPRYTPSSPLGPGHSSVDITWHTRNIHPEPQSLLPKRICDSIWLSDALGPRAGAEAAAGVCWERKVQEDTHGKGGRQCDGGAAAAPASQLNLPTHSQCLIEDSGRKTHRREDAGANRIMWRATYALGRRWKKWNVKTKNNRKKQKSAFHPPFCVISFIICFYLSRTVARAWKIQGEGF